MKEKKDFKILVVDDDPILLKLTIRPLKKADYNVISASSGKECLRVLHIEKPEIILLDVMLLDVNGKNICKIIKKDPETSSIFIILLSSLRTSSDHVSEGLEEGADGYITRPVDSREHLARVEAARRLIDAEKKNMANEMLLKACIDSPKDMTIIAIDRNYNYLAFNTYHKDVMFQAYGTEVKPGLNLMECMKGEEDIVKAKGNYDRAMAGESHITIEEYGDLDRQYYETRYNPIFNEKNEIIGATAFAANVTERRRMEISLNKSEEKFRTAFTTSPDAVSINRLRDGLFVMVNKGFSIMTGHSEEDTKGKTSYDLGIWTNPSDREKIATEIKITGRINNYEGNFKQKDGTVRYGLMSATIIELEGIPHILSITRDVTELKQMEASLKESEIYFKDVFETVSVGVANTSLDGMVLAINGALKDILEVSKEEIVGKNIINLAKKLLSVRNIAVAIPALTSLLRGKEIKTFQVEYKDKILEVSATINPKSNRLTGIIRDITVLKKAEDTLGKKIVELEWLNNMMINREVKMIELKKEVNGLLNMTGQKDKYVIHEKGE